MKHSVNGKRVLRLKMDAGWAWPLLVGESH